MRKRAVSLRAPLRRLRKAGGLPLSALLIFSSLATAQAPSAPAPAPDDSVAAPEQGAAAASGVDATTGFGPADSGRTDVNHWLEKLSRAVTGLEYSGLVTFEHAGVLETLEVVHAVREGQQVERVRYLSGEPRELISHGSSDSCERTGNPLARTELWRGASSADVQQTYHFILRGSERIADRDAVVIEARPRDRDRLGMVVSLDRETGLPLKSMLVGTQGRVLERYQFVRLDLSPIQDTELEPKSDSARRIDNSGACALAQSRWQLGWLPAGFEPVSVRPLADGDMLVFSDGLSVFTVFVQRLGPELDFKGRAIRGATVAYMDRIEVDGVDYTVTVVGEIPDTTARRVAGSVSASG